MRHSKNLFYMILICLLSGLMTGLAQGQDEDATRRFWPPNFRPGAAAPSAAKPRQDRYKRTSPALAKDKLPLDSTVDNVVGITVWRLRPAKETDEARILVKKSGKAVQWTPERVEAQTTFSEGQMLRLSIEIPRTGWLYVIDRELYADGSMSDPYLIFPTNQASNENRVSAGRVVEIPNQQDEQAYFEMKSLGKDGGPAQVAEMLTMIIASSPIKDLPQRAAGDDSPILLSKSLVEKWEKEWAAEFEQLELEGGAGKSYTKAEQSVGSQPAKTLSQDDALPQTVFRVAMKSGKPLVVKLPLKIK
ncbi:MAG: hypothetical protein IPO77_19775 [Acidobacteria bacterium]|nr:hypothetical protein [Acidobacteriota bacterium]